MAQPEKKFKCGACSASVFVNQVKTADGMVPMKSVSLQRAYKDKDGNFSTRRASRTTTFRKQS